MRLDIAIVERGLAPTRSRARDAIKRGGVRVGGAVETRPGSVVEADADIRIDDPAKGYVSRAAIKLIAGLDGFGIDPCGAQALDVGASTGGFTQALLERGASHVVALDVGHGQLANEIGDDPRVTSLEGLNARDLKAEDLPYTPDHVVADVSFISIRLALPPALSIAARGSPCVLLVKPQFEVGRDGIGKGGIVPPERAEREAEALRGWLDEQPGWRSVGLLASPIAGGSGNREWLLGGVKDRE